MSQNSAELGSIGVVKAAPPRRRSVRVGDQLFSLLLIAAAWVIFLVVVGLFVALAVAAWPAIKGLGISVASVAWDPTNSKFGMVSFIFGTAMTSLVALV